MNNDFKKASYLLTIIFFLAGIAALVGVSAAKYFEFDETVVTVSQIISLAAFFIMFINCIYSKSKYNSACVRFADYILTNRRKDEERKAAEAERLKEMKSIREAAEHDREKAIEAARQQGRSEGVQSAQELNSLRQPLPPQQLPIPMAQTFVTPQPTPLQPQGQRVPVQPSAPAPVQQRMPVQPSAPAPVPQRMPVQQSAPAPVQQPAAVQQRKAEPPRNIPVQREVEPPNEEMLYNEYGEPVMMRRRVRKTSSSPDGEMLYDSYGNPVIRRNQGLWEPLEQRHEIVFKFETAPGVTISQQTRNSQQNRSDDSQ